MPLSAKQNEYLAVAFACFETEPKIDFEKFRLITGHKSAASARELMRVTKIKLKAEYFPGAANGDTSATAPATPAKKTKAAAANGTSTPKRARATATPKGKKAKVETQAVIKNEEGDDDEAEEPARKKSKSHSVGEIVDSVVADDGDDFVL